MQSQSRRTTGVRGITVAVLATGLTLAACSSGSTSPAGGSAAPSASTVASSSGGSSSSSSSSSSGGSGAVAAAAADVAKYNQPVSSFAALPAVPGVASLKGKTVWYVPFGDAIDFLATAGVGLTEALHEAGVTVHVCDGKLQPTQVASCLDEAGNQHAAAVVTGYVDYRLVPNAFESLRAKGIPVLVGGEANDSGKPASSGVAYYDTSQTEIVMQRLLVESVIADSHGTAHVVYVGNTDSPNIIEISKYGRTYLTDHCPACTMSTVDFGTPSVSKLPSQINAALITHPDTNYVIEAFDEGAGSIASALQTAGKTSSVKFAAGGNSLDSLQRVSSGNNQFVLSAYSPTFTGWQFADGILRMLGGSTPDVTTGAVRVFDKANSAGLSLTPNGYASFGWYGSGDGYRTNFLHAWGITG